MRYKVELREQRAIDDIASELAVVRSQQCAVETVLPEIRRLLEVDAALVVSPLVDGSGLRLERFHAAGFTDPARMERAFQAGFGASPVRYAWYDPARPEPWQRNRVIDARDLMSDEELQRSKIYERCLRPAGLHYQRQPRVLLCEGSALLGWFGAFQSGRVEPRHRALLKRLIAPMKRRLAIDRKLDLVRRQLGALDAAIDEIGAPAVILSKDGVLCEGNAGARTLLADRRAAMRGALRDALAGRPQASEISFELTPLEERGTSHGWLAVARGSRDSRIAACLASASAAWQLSPRQQQVLRAIVAGQANVSIAIDLGVTVRAVELQVSSLLVRAGVESRAGLVAAVVATFG